MIGAIEAGGTKFVCAVSDENLNVIEQVTIPTTNPTSTFKNVFHFFDKFNLKAMGIGSFGPIDNNDNSDMYGYITSTPKTLWRNTNFLGTFKKRYNIPIGWNTDVNLAALGEVHFGAAKNKKSCVYITVGTGIGGGVIINNEPLTGYNHPEMGHIIVPRYETDTYLGSCNYHGGCLEGLASGPAIEGRYGIKAEDLPLGHEIWEMEAHYLAHATMVYTLTYSPDCIIFGGGVMNQKHILPLVRKKFKKIMADYVKLPPLDEYIIPTGLGNESGIMGCLLYGKQQLLS